MKSYSRKAYPGMDPNDRSYSRELEETIKRMDAESLSDLLNGTQEETDAQTHAAWDSGLEIKTLKFRKEDRIQIIKGKYRGQLGIVRALAATQPSPTYILELDGGHEVRAPESVMAFIKPSPA